MTNPHVNSLTIESTPRRLMHRMKRMVHKAVEVDVAKQPISQAYVLIMIMIYNGKT